jgi:electron transfer flavoprotein alpha subunit
MVTAANNKDPAAPIFKLASLGLVGAALAVGRARGVAVRNIMALG